MSQLLLPSLEIPTGVKAGFQLSQLPSTVVWMGGFYWERVCNLGSERGDSSGSSEGKQRTKGQLVCHEHPGGGLKPRPGTTAVRIMEVL